MNSSRGAAARDGAWRGGFLESARITKDHATGARKPPTHYQTPKVQCTRCPWVGIRMYVLPGDERANRPVGWGVCPRCGGAVTRRTVQRHIVVAVLQKRRTR